jgi:hypothetical protein
MCGGGNPISAITDPISSAIGTDGGGGGVLGALADIDPGPAIGSGLAEVDDFVGDEIPGGWTTVAAAAAIATGMYFSPELLASLGAEGVAASEAGFMAADAANLAAQGLSQQAIAQNLAISYGISAEAAATAAGAAAAGEFTSFTPDMINFANSSGDPIGTIAEISGMSPEQFSIYSAANSGTELGLGEAFDEFGNIVQTFDDGSTIVRDASGNLLSTTEALSDPFQIPGVIKNAATSMAKQAAGKLLSGARNQLATGVGLKPTYGTGLNALNENSTLTGDTTDVGTGSGLKGDLTTANTNFTLNDFGAGATATPQLFNTGTNPAAYAPTSSQSFVPTQSVPTQSFNEGGEVDGHNPTFFSPGGLASMENTYVKGEGDGTSDSVAAMLANGEFVIPADVVSKLGNGSNDAGANVLDEFLSTIREHAQKHDPKKLPPDSKGPLTYLAQANKKARA